MSTFHVKTLLNLTFQGLKVSQGCGIRLPFNAFERILSAQLPFEDKYQVLF